ncbi:MAG: hypothetical protein AB7O37_16895 [Vicinamibacteria bacterium]
MGFFKSLFQAPRYRRFVLLGSSEKGVFWDFSVWRQRVFPSLDQLLRASDCRDPSVQCRQITKKQSKEIHFARIEWSESGAQLWCHNSEATRGECDQWLFVDLQVHCPGKETLIRQVELPRTYVQVKPMAWEGIASRTAYDQAIHIAIRQDVYAKSGVAEESVKALAQAAGAIAVYACSSRVVALNSFESLVREDFQYRGILDDDLPNEARMRGKWSRLEWQLG